MKKESVRKKQIDKDYAFERVPAASRKGFWPMLFIVLGFTFCSSSMTTSAYFGIRGMEIISYISVPLILFLGSFSMVKAIIDSGGIIAIFDKNTGGMTLFTGISLVVGSFISGGTTIPNFARFAKSGKAAAVSVVLAFFFGSCLMFAFGAVGGAFTGRDDIYYAMIAQGLAVPAIVVLGANAWTTNDNTLYSCALGLSNLTKIRKKPLVIVSGAIGTALSVWLYEHFTNWLLILNAALPPVGAFIILDYFRHRQSYMEKPQDGAAEESVKELPKAFDPGAVAGVAAGSLAGISIPYGIASVNSMVIACAVKLLWEKIAASDCQRRPGPNDG